MARRLGVRLVFLGWVLVTSTGYGQTQKGSERERQRSSGVSVTDLAEDHYQAVFEDDLLSGDGFGADLPILRVRSVRAYGFLVRPRTHFVPELLKSVEKI